MGTLLSDLPWSRGWTACQKPGVAGCRQMHVFRLPQGVFCSLQKKVVYGTRTEISFGNCGLCYATS